MSALEKLLADIHPEASIVSVEVDRHEHRDTVRCEVSGERLLSDEDLLDGFAIVTVARILFTTPEHSEPEVLSETDNEWVPVSETVLRDALELERQAIKARPVTDATVSQRGADLQRNADAWDDLARGRLPVAGGFSVRSQGLRGEVA